MKESLDLIEKVYFKNSNTKILDGKVSTQQEILEMIIEATGYNKWKQDNTEILEDSEIKELKESFNIDFKETEVNRYIFYRNTSNRDALCTIIVTVLPDLFKVDLHTDRVDYGLEGLVTTKEFIAGVAIESDS